MNKVLATVKDFKMAPNGHEFIDVCKFCLRDTGNIVVKNKRTIVSVDPSEIPKYISSNDSICDLCLFLTTHINDLLETEDGNNVLDGSSSSWGCGLLVEKNGSDENLICFVPFSSDTGRFAAIKGVGRIKFRHGMKVLCTQEDDIITMIEVLERGEDIYINFGV